ncbi:MAG: acyl-CoA dehydrogenase [Gammaproteobacteria bacterium]|nr:acyl-CoA dehydrogenase [Gammaproteobacteria bacterium]|tara:strand:- start:43080 stop:45104 length:2025 start_codon:yes stop_codon:yes gene_type:complete
MKSNSERTASAATEALAAAGDKAQAEDVAVLEGAAKAADRKLNTVKKPLLQRMIYGPKPELRELSSGAERYLLSAHDKSAHILDQALALLQQGQAFTQENTLSKSLRTSLAKELAYGFTVPQAFGGLGLDYSQLAHLEEELAANGLGAMAVELSGQLTIGSSALLAYGSEAQQSRFLPQIAQGRLIAFALTEVGVGVNAKRVQAWVELDEQAQCWRLNAEGAQNKLYITSATHGGLAAIVARKGQHSKELGLFIVELPEKNIDADYGFSCVSSDTSAFAGNINSRLGFRNFPIPLDQEIPGNGVEVLFYCLRLGRCMLAAMSAGFQRMLAADAIAYAKQREGVGGLVIKHELPRLGIVRMLGGALVAQALSHLALAQDADGVDLAGLRDITKSASASRALESLIACERVIGGRSLDKHSRITEARPTLHAFGIVEGEDDLIRLGMVKDLTAPFTEKYLQGMLSVLQGINLDKNGELLPPQKRIYTLGLKSFWRHPLKVLKAVLKLTINKGTWVLLGWILINILNGLPGLLGRLVPTVLLPRYRSLPGKLGLYLRFSERELRKSRWHYLCFNVLYQLELTRAQLPLQRFGKRIELLMSMAVICCHASKLDQSVQHIAEAQCELIKLELKGVGFFGSYKTVKNLRQSVERVIRDIQSDSCTLVKGVEPQAHSHSWH